jgi:hypothetical protein
MQCIYVDNIPQFILQVYEGDSHNLKVLNRCQALNYVTHRKLQIIPVGMITFHPRRSSFIHFASIKNLNTDFGPAPLYSASEIKIHMSNVSKDICILF